MQSIANGGRALSVAKNYISSYERMRVNMQKNKEEYEQRLPKEYKQRF